MYVTGPRLAGETGGAWWLRPKSKPWNVFALMTIDRYLPVGAFAPGGPDASLGLSPVHYLIGVPGTENAF